MNKELEDWRKKIDIIDERLLSLLSKREKVVKKIGVIKKRLNTSSLDKKRYDEHLKTLLEKADKLKLSKDFVEKFYKLIHKHFLKIQKENS